VRFSNDVKQLRPISQKFIKKYFSFKLMKITLPLLYTKKRDREKERQTDRESQRERETER
jgi:hypothetical protein